MITQVKKENLLSFYKNGLDEFHFPEKSQRCMLPAIKRVIQFMDKNSEAFYTPEIGKALIAYEKETDSISDSMTIRDAQSVRILDMLVRGTDYHLKGGPKSYPFPRKLGNIALAFVESFSKTMRFHQSTKTSYLSTLSKFCVKMDLEGIEAESLNRSHIISFISTMRNKRRYVTTPLKKFLFHLYNIGIVMEDFSQMMLGFKSEPIKLPSYLTVEEEKILEKSICRNSCIGKRNYAMILLSTRLCMRGSDIVNLEFSNINWDDGYITFMQVKTGIPQSLPIQEEVGIALIDYIKNARPLCNTRKLFITARAPIRPMTSSGYTAIVARAISHAGINTELRHHGSHTLRHSTATVMMNEGIPITTISNVLGHTTTENTKYYLNIDIKSLLECSGNVIDVPSDFYEQNGGMFYE